MMPVESEYPRIEKGRVDPGDGFLLDDDAWFVLSCGGLGVLATNGDGRSKVFTAEQLRPARRISRKWLSIMQAVSAMKGMVLGYQLAPKGLPGPLRSWLLDEMQELETLVRGTAEELIEQQAEADF